MNLVQFMKTNVLRITETIVFLGLVITIIILSIQVNNISKQDPDSKSNQIKYKIIQIK